MNGRVAKAIGFVIVIALVAMFQYVATIPAIRHLSLGEAAKSWHRTTGRVVETKSDPNAKRPSVNFVVEFEVEKALYECTEYWAGWRYSTPSSQFNSKRRGGGVEVWYDPFDPSRSCLQPGTRPQTIGIMLLGLGPIILIVGAWVHDKLGR